MTRSRAAIGITVKSGWASVVLVVGGSRAAPLVLDARRVELSDPQEPASRQPYHAGFGTARGEGPELKRLVASVNRFGRRSITSVLRDYRSAGHDLRGAGIVVGSLVDPATIANVHIRIHALEGQLFRTVVTDAAASCDVACSVWREKNLYAVAADRLNRSDGDLRAAVTELGRGVTGPWRAEQKTAALAAWLMLASSR